MKKTLIYELKEKNKNYKSHNSGITLIALIITIVVLLILAVVAIRAIKNDGIIEQAKSVTDKYKNKQREEESTLNDYLSLLDETDLIVHKDVIPTDGMYYIKDIDIVIFAGENFPKLIGDGDKYAFGDYVYTHHGTKCLMTSEEYAIYYENYDEVYKKSYQEMFKKEFLNSEAAKELGITSWDEAVEYLAKQGISEEEFWNSEIPEAPEIPEEMPESDDYTHWSVKVNDKNKTEYGPILGKINGSLVTEMVESHKEYSGGAGVGDSYITVYDGCFKGCKSMVIAPQIPSSIINMQEAFYNCSSLTTAPTIPNSVTNMDGTFYSCTSLTSAPVIPNSVTDLGNTFRGCTSLVSPPDMSNANSVTNMARTFSSCTSLTTAPTIPSSVTDMSYTFKGCTSLTTAPTIPNSVTNMDGTFYSCTSLTTAPTIPNSVTNLQQTFRDCTSLTGSITINANPTYYTSCLKGTQITSVVGETTMAEKILATK